MLCSQAQDTSSKKLHTHLPIKGDVGITLNISQIFSDFSINAPNDDVYEHFFIRKYTKNDLAWRFGIGFFTNNTSFIGLDSVSTAAVRTDSTLKNNKLYLSLGLEKHINTGSRLDPYFLASVSYGAIGKSSSNTVVELSDTTGTSSTNRIIETPGGSHFRISTGVGFNYFIAQKIALGAEYSLGYNYITTGGDFSKVVVQKSVSGTENIQRTTGTNQTQTSSFSFLGSGRLSLSYFF